MVLAGFGWIWLVVCFITNALQHLLNHKCYGLFFEACSKIPKLLLNSQRDIFNTIETNTLFGIFNNSKDLGIPKSGLTILYLKEWMLINGKSFPV